MSKVNGFMLIELLIYLALLAFIAHVLFSLLGSFAQTRVIEGRAITDQVQVLTVFNLVVRDIRRAPVKEELWKKQEPHECIWHDNKSNKDIGWYVEKGCLLRVTGCYDKDADTWIVRRRDRLVRHVQSLTFTYVKNIERKAVCCRLVFGDRQKPQSVQQWITIREEG